MCLAIPGRLVAIAGEGMDRAGVVDFGGVRKTVNLSFTPDAGIDSYVLVHVGFAIATLDPDHARSALQLVDEIDDFLGIEESSGQASNESATP